jgi:hypothetical protein
MNAHFFDFAKQNQKNGHSFIIFFRRLRRRKSFDTASEAGKEVLEHTAGLWPAVCSFRQASSTGGMDCQDFRAFPLQPAERPFQDSLNPSKTYFRTTHNSQLITHNS